MLGKLKFDFKAFMIFFLNKLGFVYKSTASFFEKYRM